MTFIKEQFREVSVIFVQSLYVYSFLTHLCLYYTDTQRAQIKIIIFATPGRNIIFPRVYLEAHIALRNFLSLVPIGKWK